MKKSTPLIILFLIILSVLFIGCVEKEIENNFHECVASDWILEDGDYTCGDTLFYYTKCITCEQIINTKEEKMMHEYHEETVDPTCTNDGLYTKSCENCGDMITKVLKATGHVKGSLKVTKSASNKVPGTRDLICANCKTTLKSYTYINNGYPYYGKLRVDGRDLVDSYGVKVQLFGLSTHGIQWFGHYANFDTIASLQEGFGMNVIRFAFYTDENGYCDGGSSKQKGMLQDLYEGIEAATKLGLYVIVDWHMVGAENEKDKNPLFYLEESKQFFSMISEKYKGQNNILYEIMNEPNGSTTWNDCKKYANEVIPCIRKNTDAVILVGNPKWTADLTSVMQDPLTGYSNIMYTYHFYANDHRSTTQVENAYDKGFPVFISEYGFMNSDGDGDYNAQAGENWLKVLDSRNISYVAWNISNSKGAASIFKYQSNNMIDVSDENLKSWGVYLKNLYRYKSHLSN